jgi:ubiquinone/menaquinone biosynthesis C-methylase UbiE
MSTNIAEVSKVFDKLAANYEDNFVEGADRYPYNLYRYQIVERFIKSKKFKKILDVGCGTGYVVRELAKQKYNVSGCDLSDNMIKKAHEMCLQDNLSPNLFFKENAITLDGVKDASCDLITYLGIHPYFDKKEEQASYSSCSRKLDKDGYAVFCYLNHLFDFYTLNRFTVDFYTDVLLNDERSLSEEKEGVREHVGELLKFSNQPQVVADASGFNGLTRLKHNPLTIKEELKQYGFHVEETHFYQFFAVPPLMRNKFEERFLSVGKSFEFNRSTHWKGNFLAHQFLVVAKKC